MSEDELRAYVDSLNERAQKTANQNLNVKFRKERFEAELYDTYIRSGFDDKTAQHLLLNFWPVTFETIDHYAKIHKVE